MQKVIKAALILTLVSILVAFVRDTQLNQQKLELKQIEIKETSLELKQLNRKYDKELEKTEVNQKTIEQLNKEKEELNKQLQAKKEAEAKLAQQKIQASQAVYAASNTPSDVIQGSHSDWMRQAGIAESDFGYVEYIIQKESGWNFRAKNPSSSATGLCQTMLSIHPVPATFKDNPVEQLQWCANYAKRRYASWGGAYSFWLRNHWW